MNDIGAEIIGFARKRGQALAAGDLTVVEGVERDLGELISSVAKPPALVRAEASLLAARQARTLLEVETSQMWSRVRDGLEIRSIAAALEERLRLARTALKVQRMELSEARAAHARRLAVALAPMRRAQAKRLLAAVAELEAAGKILAATAAAVSFAGGEVVILHLPDLRITVASATRISREGGLS